MKNRHFLHFKMQKTVTQSKSFSSRLKHHNKNKLLTG